MLPSLPGSDDNWVGLAFVFAVLLGVIHEWANFLNLFYFNVSGLTQMRTHAWLGWPLHMNFSYRHTCFAQRIKMIEHTFNHTNSGNSWHMCTHTQPLFHYMTDAQSEIALCLANIVSVCENLEKPRLHFYGRQNLVAMFVLLQRDSKPKLRVIVSLAALVIWLQALSA